VVVLPSVFAIENNGHQGIAPPSQNAGAVVADAAEEIAGGRGGLHLGINEADEIA